MADQKVAEENNPSSEKPQEVDVCVLYHVQLLGDARLTLSMGFSRQEYWSGLPFPSAGDLSDSGIEPSSPASPALQEDSLPLSHPGSPRLG